MKVQGGTRNSCASWCVSEVSSCSERGHQKGKCLRSTDLMHEPGRPVAWKAREDSKAQALITETPESIHLLTCDRINPA